MKEELKEKVNKIICNYAYSCWYNEYVKLSLEGMLQDSLTEDEYKELPTYESDGETSICIPTILNNK